MAEDDRIDYRFKIVIIGESGVGKSSLLLNYTDNVFHNTFITTIGIDFKVKKIELGGSKIKLHLWDTAGQERFKAINRSFYHNADGIVLVFDVTNAESFKRLSFWLDQIKASSTVSNSVQKIMIGNKTDMPEKRAVSYDECQSFAQTNGMEYVETSAKTSSNVDLAFTKLATNMKKDNASKINKAPKVKIPTLKINPPTAVQNKCSCN